MRLKDDTRLVSLNWYSPFSLLQLRREPTTLKTALIASSCCSALSQILRLISDTPRASATSEPFAPLPAGLLLRCRAAGACAPFGSSMDTSGALRTAATRGAGALPPTSTGRLGRCGSTTGS